MSLEVYMHKCTPTCKSFPNTHTLPHGCCPITQATFQMGISCWLLLMWRRNAANCRSFIARDIPPLPKELLIWLMNLFLQKADSIEKKHRLHKGNRSCLLTKTNSRLYCRYTTIVVTRLAVSIPVFTGGCYDIIIIRWMLATSIVTILKLGNSSKTIVLFTHARPTIPAFI